MGLDIYFEKARKSGLEETTKKMNDLRSKRTNLYHKMEEIINCKKMQELTAKAEAQREIYYKEEDKELANAHRTLLNSMEEDIRHLREKREQLKSYKSLETDARTISEELDSLNPYKEVCYFRKVNLLMEYFHYEGNCEYQEVSKEEVEELIDRCTQVLADHSKAEELLPTQGGFFFGSTEYDEYYFQDVQEVHDKFAKALDDVDFDNEYFYMYCWW